jgi:hypothetical protein
MGPPKKIASSVTWLNVADPWQHYDCFTYDVAPIIELIARCSTLENHVMLNCVARSDPKGENRLENSAFAETQLAIG